MTRPTSDVLLVRCPACGSSGRVPGGKLARGLAPRCGRGEARLPVDRGPVTVGDTTFVAEVRKSYDGPPRVRREYAHAAGTGGRSRGGG
jgi:hypothetical protein